MKSSLFNALADKDSINLSREEVTVTEETRPKSYVHIRADGTVSGYFGEQATSVMQMRTQLMGLKLWVSTGMQLTSKMRMPILKMIKTQYGIKGNKKSVLAQFEAMVSDAWDDLPVVRD